MKTPSGGPPRSGLTAASFEALLARLDSDRERAGERYETIRRRLVRLFEWRGCERPEELADETINRVARRMSEGTEIRATDPLGYFFGVAHRVYKEVLRARQKERERVASGGLAQASETAADEELDGRLSCIRLCLDRLEANQRRLILQYHQGDDRIRNRQGLSRELGIPLNALRIRAYRVRRQLVSCVEECLERGLQ
ncbi:MAG TPA: hypothetical protein VOA87_02755 [Thermoanaerobaculia bacterium]|nr:hypothetical protein [Thermoanaerobaculia bacterium]